MRNVRLALACLVLNVLATTAMALDYETVGLVCYANSSNPTNGPTFASGLGTANVDSFYVTDYGSNETAAGGGFEFANTNDKEVDCFFPVPANYDNYSSEPPYVTIYGWLEATDSCSSSCPTFRYVRLKLATRVFGSGSALSMSWTTGANGDVGIAGVSSTPTLYKKNIVMVSNPIDATSAASDWLAGRLVHIRFRRDTGVTDNAAQTFYMAVVTLTYVRL